MVESFIIRAFNSSMISDGQPGSGITQRPITLRAVGPGQACPPQVETLSLAAKENALGGFIS